MCLETTLKGLAPAGDSVPVDQGARPRPGLSRRDLFKAGAAAGAVAGLSGLLPATRALASRTPTNRTADLSQVFRAGFPVYTGPTPTRTVRKTIESDGFYTQEWSFWEHSATHMDAPGHFSPGGRLSPDIDPQELIRPAVVVDISSRAAADPDAEVLPSDLVAFERRHGRIPRRSVVLMSSGWEDLAGDADAYRNVGPDGLFHFPGFSIDAVEWLVERRDIQGIGVDTLSLDNGESQTFAVHVFLLGADRYGLENVRNLKGIPPRGASVFVGLIPWEEGSGGPCRVIARW